MPPSPTAAGMASAPVLAAPVKATLASEPSEPAPRPTTIARSRADMVASAWGSRASTSATGMSRNSFSRTPCSSTSLATTARRRYACTAHDCLFQGFLGSRLMSTSSPRPRTYSDTLRTRSGRMRTRSP
ncbi:MAG: hypothetical protein KatS3mg103_1385 [Phycisphaerales bacterium]|nr:MAG: hypothetical protein KatS3mg103_1385 [Phycisphaerales bacterium]